MFTAQQEDCGGRGPCTWKGDWVSDDGKQNRKNVRLAGDDVRVDNVGERVDALDTGSPTSVYADRHIGNTLWVVVWVLGAVALLVFCGRVIWRLLREHLLLRANRNPGSR
ncbi:hypothetical protein ACSNOI_00280 [Actinomadura kijaniata]|uniref:hypothetical protein n=1 Tax=Actinomadura kijaniata TaxID=46161 RepID=UPI003F1B278F